jgi:hypothetical protein
MTIFVAHAPADREAAEALERRLERRGHFVELDDGETALRPMQHSDVLVLLTSKDLSLAPARLRLEQRALEAWSEQRLVVVMLDQAAAPVGLRDLPAIDASLEADREAKWQDVVTAVRRRLGQPGANSVGQTPPARDGPRYSPAPATKGRWVLAILQLLLAIPGLVAIAATVSIWLANRIGPQPAGIPELRTGLDAFGGRFGLSAGITEWIFLLAGILTFVVVAPRLLRFVLVLIGLLLSLLPQRRGAGESAATDPAPANRTTENTVFVSYARANAPVVLPVIEAAKSDGRKFWIDQQGIGAGDGWAAEIVRAIRAAGGVVIMCSKAAFESDHVKREIYLADRYRKKLTPVFIEQADPPEDFEYFFAGVQMLNLFDKPEAERPQALLRALGANS